MSILSDIMVSGFSVTRFRRCKPWVWVVGGHDFGENGIMFLVILSIRGKKLCSQWTCYNPTKNGTMMYEFIQSNSMSFCCYCWDSIQFNLILIGNDHVKTMSFNLLRNVCVLNYVVTSQRFQTKLSSSKRTWDIQNPFLLKLK